MSFDSFPTFKRFRYKGQSDGARKYLEMVNRSRGIIKDDVMKSVLAHSLFEFEDDVHAQSKYEPDALFKALSAFDCSHKFNPDGDVFARAVSRVRNSFKKLEGKLIPMQPKTVISYLRNTASAGAPYFGQKGDVLKEHGYEAARVGVEPCVAYYRTQNRKNSSGDFKQKVRLVWGYPLDTTICEGTFARPVIEALVVAKTPYVLGNQAFQTGAQLNALQWSNYVGSFDWSGFDAKVPPQLISVAFGMIKRWFIPGSVDNSDWDKVTKYFSMTPILMPDGKVYVGKRGGIPSGSYFTGIVGSIVNLILIQYLTMSQGVDIFEDHILVMGDDSIIGLPQELNVKEMGKVADEQFGMVLHPEKQRYSRYTSVVSFLSHEWEGGRPSRDTEETLSKLVYSERPWPREIEPAAFRITKLVSAYGDNYKSWTIISQALWDLGIRTHLDPVRGFTVYSNLDDKTGEIGLKKVKNKQLCRVSY